MKSKHDLFSLLSGIAKRRSGPISFEEYERERQAATTPQSAASRGAPGICTLTVKCVWGPGFEPCTRVIEMKEDSSLTDLHHAIQNAVNFDDDHLYEFFAGRNWRKREILFSETGDWESEGADLEAIQLHRIWPLPEKMKLHYWFDFGDDWKFQITKGKVVKPPEKGVKYPRVIKEIGPDPEQYPGLD